MGVDYYYLVGLVICTVLQKGKVRSINLSSACSDVRGIPPVLYGRRSGIGL